LDGTLTPTVGTHPAPAAQVAAPAPPPTAPNLATPNFAAPLDTPLPCPLCEYDLRGLTEPRCPECGYRYTPGELNDPARRFHPYLFEHHKNRNAWSFARTLVGGLRPAKFCSTLHPTQPSRPLRLLLYYCTCAAPLAALSAIHIFLLVQGAYATVLNWRMWSFRGVAADPARLARWVARFDVDGGGYGLFALFTLAWPWLTLISLLVFQVSLRRARLRWTHVLRCVLYAGDVCVWIVPPLGFLGITAWYAGGGPLPRDYFWNLSALLPWAILAWLTSRLYTAYRLYLRFYHALATVLASQAIVTLVYYKLWLMAEGY
jgi:hypothetical protein